MSISRRQFILGTASGLILPSYYDKVFTFFENHGEPLIVIPKQADTELLIVDEYLQFHVRDPCAEPPEMTVRAFALKHCGSEEAYQEDWCDGEEGDFDAFQDPEIVIDYWARHDSSNAQAFYLLEGLDLGPDLDRKNAVGEIRFIDGACPGNDYLGVEAADQVLDQSVTEATQRTGYWYPYLYGEGEMSDLSQNREELVKKITDAKHMSKPNAKNAIVVRDANGRWIFEMYIAEHTVEGVSV